MRLASAASNRNAWLFSVIIFAFLLVFPYLAPKQAFIAATLLVIAYAILYRGGRILTLFLTAIFIAVTTVSIVLLVAR